MDSIQLAMTIIAFAGDSQSYSNEAIASAKKGEFEKAAELIDKAKETCLESHKAHTKLISMAAVDPKMEVNMLMVHASNHYSVAEVEIKMAELFLLTVKEMSKKC